MAVYVVICKPKTWMTFLHIATLEQCRALASTGRGADTVDSC